MAVLFFAGVAIAYWAESRGNPLLAGTDQIATVNQSGGNMEGKKVRFGIANSVYLRPLPRRLVWCGQCDARSFTPMAVWFRWPTSCSAKQFLAGVALACIGILIYVVLAVSMPG